MSKRKRKEAEADASDTVVATVAAEKPTKRARNRRDPDPQEGSWLASHLQLPADMLYEIVMTGLVETTRSKVASDSDVAEAQLALFCLRRTCRGLYRCTRIDPAHFLPRDAIKYRRNMGELALRARCVPVLRESIPLGLLLHQTRTGAIETVMSEGRFDVAWSLMSLAPWYAHRRNDGGDLPLTHVHDRCITTYRWIWTTYLETLAATGSWLMLKRALLAPTSGLRLYAYELIHCLLVMDRSGLAHRAAAFCQWLDQCMHRKSQAVLPAMREACAWITRSGVNLSVPEIRDLVARYTARSCGRPACVLTAAAVTATAGWVECDMCGKGRGGYCSAECQTLDRERHLHAGRNCAAREWLCSPERDVTAAYYAKDYAEMGGNVLIRDRLHFQQEQMAQLLDLQRRMDAI